MKKVLCSILLTGLLVLTGCTGKSGGSLADNSISSNTTGHIDTSKEATDTPQLNKNRSEKNFPSSKVTPQPTQPSQEAAKSTSPAIKSPVNPPKAIMPSPKPLPTLEPSPTALKYSYNIEDFGFILNYGVLGKNSLNTFENKYTKDLASNGSITVDFTLTQEEILYIFDEMKRINILDYPTKYYPPDNDNQLGIHRIVKPYQSYYFKMRIGAIEKEITWIDSNISDSKKAILLRELINKIVKVIKEKDEYKNLPKVGGYS